MQLASYRLIELELVLVLAKKLKVTKLEAEDSDLVDYFVELVVAHLHSFNQEN